MSQGLYKAGIDYPFIIMSSGIESRVSLLLRDAEGSPEVGLRCIFMFISAANSGSSFTIPDTVGESMLAPRNGIIELNWLTVYPAGYLRVLAFAGNYLAADGICRYDTAIAARAGHTRALTFEGQRSVHSATQSSGTTDTDSSSRTGTTSVTTTGTFAPGGVGASVAVQGSVADMRGTSTARTAGTATTRPSAGSALLIQQITAAR